MISELGVDDEFESRISITTRKEAQALVQVYRRPLHNQVEMPSDEELVTDLGDDDYGRGTRQQLHLAAAASGRASKAAPLDLASRYVAQGELAKQARATSDRSKVNFVKGSWLG